MVISNKLVYTRKEHTCWGCGIKFPSRSDMSIMTEVRDGKILSTSWCEVCNDFVKKPDFDWYDDIVIGDLRDEEQYKEFKKLHYG